MLRLRGEPMKLKNSLFLIQKQKLTEIINSQEYPNLHYNARRNCITSYMFYGGNVTYFLNIKQDKLEGFGKVEFSNDSIYSYKIKSKQEILLKRRLINQMTVLYFFQFRSGRRININSCIYKKYMIQKHLQLPYLSLVPYYFQPSPKPI